MRQAQRENPPLRGVSIEERSYVENAVVSGARVSETERAVAGQMGAEFTGPSPAEITAAGGSYQEAAEKAAQAQGLTAAPTAGSRRSPMSPNRRSQTSGPYHATATELGGPMQVPMRLYRRSSDRAIVETLAPGESGTLLYGQGAALIESIAEASGVADYLRHRSTTTQGGPSG